jgi:hypothetical protein
MLISFPWPQPTPSTRAVRSVGTPTWSQTGRCPCSPSLHTSQMAFCSSVDPGELLLQVGDVVHNCEFQCAMQQWPRLCMAIVLVLFGRCLELFWASGAIVWLPAGAILLPHGLAWVRSVAVPLFIHTHCDTYILVSTSSSARLSGHTRSLILQPAAPGW